MVVDGGLVGEHQDDSSLSLGTHLAGINVIIGLIQILIVLIPPFWEIFQNKQHIRDAAA